MKKIILIITVAIIAAVGIVAFIIFKKFPPPAPKPPIEQVGKCGDNICDAFEKANPNACPFDCKIEQSSQASQSTSRANIPSQSAYIDSPFGGLLFFSLDTSLRKGPPPKPDDFDFVPTKDLGLKWGRAHYLTWSMVQPTKDAIDKKVYDWSDSDSVLGAYPKGFNVLENIVAFPAKVDETGEHLENFSFPTKNDEENYARFVEKAVERYDGDGKDDMPNLKNPIKYWQVDNEPDAKTTDWKGYSHTLKITYQAVRRACSDCRVVVGGMALGQNGLTNFFKPAMEELGAQYFDIFDYHFYGNKDEWLKNGEQAEEIRKIFPNYDFEIWLTETGTWSGKPAFPPSQTSFQSEKEQAVALVKYYIKPLSVGVKKIFWAWGILEGFGGPENNTFDNTGLIYDGDGPYDLGFGVKKLSYYTYKKMTEILEGSDWDNIETVQEKDGVYVYKFMKNGKPVWVAWNDNDSEKQVTISDINSSSVKITEAVPNYSSGKEVNDYSTAFKTETKQIINNKLTMTLNKTPIFVERIGAFFILKKPAPPNNPQTRGLPDVFFAVHFEPRSADERGFEELKNFIQMADDFKVKLTLQFAPSWAKMILSDENKLGLLRRWQANGHEIAAHHHGATHGWEWDGYTNLSASEWQKTRQEVYSRSGQDKKAVQSLAKQNNIGEKYFGNMDDYMILLRKLAGSEKIFTMTMGPDRKTDWPEEIPYSLDNIVMLPNGDYNIGGTAIVKLKKEIYSGHNVSEIDMRFIENLNEVEKAKEEYLRAKPSDVVGVVTHIEDFARDHNTPRAWMEFINKKDPSGERNKTIAEVMEKIIDQ